VLTVHVLGPVEVRRDGVALDLGGPQQRAVIAHLAIDVGRVVSVERLIDRLWGEDPPRTPLGTLQSYVSRLRRAIEPQRAAGAAPQVLVSDAPGYVLRLPPEAVDVHRFTAIVNEARSAAAAGYAAQALEHFDAALALWRGPALAGVGPDEEVRPIVVRFEEERALALEDRFETLLALGRHAEAIPALQLAVDEHPLRERLWALLALALYRSSRQADALRALSSARSSLLDELGLDPGPELRTLENRILAQDPALLATPDVVAPKPAVSEPVARPHAELVGRTHEWAALTGTLDAALADAAQVVLVEGEPGIGKSTVSDAFLAHARSLGWRTATGRCVESGLAPSLWPAIEILRALIAETSPIPEAALRNALYQFAASDEPVRLALSPVELADQFVGLVDALDVGPLLMLVDDLHWADKATLDVVTLAAERLGPRHIVVVGAFRPPQIVPGSLLADALGRLTRAATVTRVSMSPLCADDVARLMELTTGTAPTPEVAERVQLRAGGNPLFVAELARLAGERGVTDERSVPEAIRDVVRSRLAQLPDSSTHELQVAATIGERFDLRTAMAASERDADGCLDALDAAIVTRILVPDGDGYRFAHALVRDAVLGQLTPLRRARLHHRVAEALFATYGDGPDQAEPIAHHRLAAVAVADPIGAARAAIRASDVARWRGALEAADELAERALEVLTELPRNDALEAVEIEALEAIAAAAYRRDTPDAKEAVAARVLALAERTGNDAARALAMFLNWDEIDETDDLEKISDAAARALAEHTTDRYALVTARYMIASRALLVGALEESYKEIHLAIAAAGPTDPDEPPQHVPLVLVPVVAAVVAAVRGEAEEARIHTRRRAPAWLSERSQVDPTAQVALAFNRALIEALLGSPDGVLHEMRTVDLTDACGFISQQVATCEVLAGWARASKGDRAGVDLAFSGMAQIDDGPELVLRSALRTFLGHALLEADDERAIATLAESRREGESRGELWWMPETIRLQALADRRFAGGAATADLLDEAETLATRLGAGIVLPRIAASR
jgi:DNA-binding SARP family transcriptional activator